MSHEERLIVKDPASWARITAAAAEQKTADLIALAQTPLAYGESIAWSITALVGTVTHGLSSAHRVGLPKGNVAYTVCDVAIPDPAKWLSLSPAFTAALTPCGFCEAAMADHRRGIAA